jgi:hypothetical protein
MFDSSVGAGPVSLMCSTTPEEMADRLKANPAAAHQLCQDLATRLLVLEELTSTEALQLGGNPREGKSTSPFIRAYRDPLPPPGTADTQPGTGPVGEATGTTKSLFTYRYNPPNIASFPRTIFVLIRLLCRT